MSVLPMRFRVIGYRVSTQTALTKVLVACGYLLALMLFFGLVFGSSDDEAHRPYKDRSMPLSAGVAADDDRDSLRSERTDADIAADIKRLLESLKNDEEMKSRIQALLDARKNKNPSKTKTSR